MYRVFLNRDADRTELDGWLSRIANGKTRADIISGFANSEEYRKIQDSMRDTDP